MSRVRAGAVAFTGPAPVSVEALRPLVGSSVGVSAWHTLDQGRIDAFAALTGDDQFIHTDPERAAAQTPFGGTVAHGFLTLSLLSIMAVEAVPSLSGASLSVNYGFDRVRFIAPVPAGSQVRARFVLDGLDESRPGEITFTLGVTMDLAGSGKPALAAVWIVRHFTGGAAP